MKRPPIDVMRSSQLMTTSFCCGSASDFFFEDLCHHCYCDFLPDGYPQVIKTFYTLENPRKLRIQYQNHFVYFNSIQLQSIYPVIFLNIILLVTLWNHVASSNHFRTLYFCYSLWYLKIKVSISSSWTNEGLKHAYSTKVKIWKI